jgi:hypothetical protein
LLRNPSKCQVRQPLSSLSRPLPLFLSLSWVSSKEGILEVDGNPQQTGRQRDRQTDRQADRQPGDRDRLRNETTKA